MKPRLRPSKGWIFAFPPRRRVKAMSMFGSGEWPATDIFRTRREALASSGGADEDRLYCIDLKERRRL
jgi:hypothetical protein